MKDYQERNYRSCCRFFFLLCTSVFSSPLPCICCQCLSSFMLFFFCFFSLDGFLYTFFIYFFIYVSSVSQAFSPLPPSICIASAACHSTLLWRTLVEKCHLLNSLGEILVSLKLVAKFPLTLVWPGFHPLALKCSALLRASTSVSSALLQAVWLHQKLEQKEWCYRATALGRSFLAVKHHVSSPVRDLCDKFIWVPELLCLSDWASFASHFIFLVLFSFDVWLL